MRSAIILAALLTLGGCGITTWFKGDENVVPPAELVEFTPAYRVTVR